MNVLEKYSIVFTFLNGNPIVKIDPKFNILSQYLMFWDNCKDIVEILVPEINFGMKYGTEDRFFSLGEVKGVEEKVKLAGESRNNDGILPFIDIDKTWEEIKVRKGYYIKELDF